MTRTRRRLWPALAALFAALVLLMLPGVAGASTTVDGLTAQQYAKSLHAQRLFVAPGGDAVLPDSDASPLRAEVRDVDDLYIVVLPNSAQINAKRFLSAIESHGGSGTYAVVNGHSLMAASNTIDGAGRIADEAASDASSTKDAIANFTKGIEENQRSGSSSGATGGGAPVGLIVFGVIAVLVIGGITLSVRRANRIRSEQQARQLAELKQAVQEDITLLGEDITSLDLEVKTADTGLQAATADDYRQALDAYDAAKNANDAATGPADMQAVTKALDDGRYAMSCVRARLTGQPIPDRRPPCFFNPQHGPSTQDVTWAPRGGTPRQVPACAADAQRVMRGEEPEARMVPYGGMRRPYWEAGPAYAPYAGGYYGGVGDLFGGMLIGTALGSMMGGGWGGGWGAGYDAGMNDSFGGGDFGGDDFGGGDFGGGDFGGGFGGFGGGDFGGGGFGGGDF